MLLLLFKVEGKVGSYTLKGDLDETIVDNTGYFNLASFAVNEKTGRFMLLLLLLLWLGLAAMAVSCLIDLILLFLLFLELEVVESRKG